MGRHLETRLKVVEAEQLPTSSETRLDLLQGCTCRMREMLLIGHTQDWVSGGPCGPEVILVAKRFEIGPEAVI